MTSRDFLDHALRAFRREPWMVAMVALAIGLGIGASMCMLAILRAMSANPVPDISSRLFFPSFDASPPGFAEESRSDPSSAFTWIDVQALLHAKRAPQQSANAAARMLLQPEAEGQSPFHASGRFVTWQFFPMFEAPFHTGSGWSEDDDASAARVIVLNGRLARTLFGNDNAIGKAVRLEGTLFRATGVLEDWRPRPLFYADTKGDVAFAATDEFFLPLSTAMANGAGFAGSMTCWGRDADRRGDACAWLQFWVRLEQPQQARAYRDFLHAYVQSQRDAGRPIGHSPPALLNFDERMQKRNLIPPDIALQSWLALGLLGVCIANVTCLLMARTLRRASDIGLRRALGASRGDILREFGTEAFGMALASAAIGLLVAASGIWSIRQRPDGYAQLVQLDGALMLSTIVVSVVSMMLAMILPALNASRIAPASALKAA